jgi:hypothetical protein
VAEWPPPPPLGRLILATMKELSIGGTQGGYKSKHRLPNSLRNFGFEEKTWVSEDWTNLPNGVQSFQQEHESKVICALISELNGFFNLGLGSEPGFDRMNEGEAVPEKPRILMIGSSHVVKEADILADRGYEVTLVSKPGWRATRGAVDEMLEKIKEAMVNLTSRDIIVIQFLDNVSYMVRSEKGGDLPIRRYIDGEFHIEGDLILAGKER